MLPGFFPSLLILEKGAGFRHFWTGNGFCSSKGEENGSNFTGFGALDHAAGPR